MRQALNILSEKSNIHGLSHLIKNESSRTEKWVLSRKTNLSVTRSLIYRIFWTCSLTVSSAILFLLICFTVTRFLSRETIVEQNHSKIPVGEVPFPAVTFCPDSLVFEMMSEFGNKSRNGNFSNDEWIF